MQEDSVFLQMVVNSLSTKHPSLRWSRAPIVFPLFTVQEVGVYRRRLVSSIAVICSLPIVRAVSKVGWISVENTMPGCE